MGPGVRNYYPRYPVLVTNRSGWVVGVKKLKFRRKRGCTNKSVEYESNWVSIDRIFIQKVFQELKNSISKKCWYLVLFYDWMDALAKMKKYFVGTETGQLLLQDGQAGLKNLRCEAPSPDLVPRKNPEWGHPEVIGCLDLLHQAFWSAAASPIIWGIK